MNFVHAFWSKPMIMKKFLDYETAVKVNLVNYATSVALIHSHGHTIDLYTDEVGRELFSDIPYDNVYIIENRIDNHHFAASFKFEVLQRLNLDEILIDGDILLRKPEIYRFIDRKNPDVLVSFFEPHSYLSNYSEGISENNIQMFSDLSEIPFLYPYQVPKDFDKCDGWFNTSFIKISNQKLKDIWIQEYYENLNKIKDISNINYWPDVILEQYNLTKLVNEYQFIGEPLIKGFPSQGANQFALYLGFAHIGSIKKDFHPHCVELLKTIDEDLFNRINSSILNKIEFMNNFESTLNYRQSVRETFGFEEPTIKEIITDTPDEGDNTEDPDSGEELEQSGTVTKATTPEVKEEE